MNSSLQKAGARPEIHTTAKVWDRIVPYVFILPFIISFAVFFVFPSVYSLVLSFFSYKGYGNARFVGLSNYYALLTYGTFWTAVKNTLFYFIVHSIPVMLFAFLLAIAMYSKLLAKVQAIYKPILFLPQIVPIIASALVFRIMFATNYGAVNQILGIKADWLGDVNIMRWAVIILIIWRTTGWYMVIYLAGLTTVSDEITDACRIDGTNTLQKTVFVIVPMMKPIFLFAFIMDAIGSFKIFTEPNVLIVGQGIVTPPDAAPIMNILTNNINGGSFGMASATGWLLFIMIFIVSMIQFRFFSERG